MSLDVMERVIKCATAKEIDFLLYIMRYQDNLGVVKGITKDEVCEALGIHKSKFYAMLLSLEAKNVIRVFWSEKRRGFWTLSIIDNSFSGKGDYKKGYINLNAVFLWTKEFIALTKAEKTICLKILSLYRENRKTMTLKITTMSDWTKSKASSVKKYIASVSALFDITVGKGVITVNLHSNAFSRNSRSENDVRNEHLVNYILAAKKARQSDFSEMRDTLTIFKTLGGKCGINAVITAIVKCVDNFGGLVPKYINSLTRLIGKNKKLIELFY